MFTFVCMHLWLFKCILNAIKTVIRMFKWHLMCQIRVTYSPLDIIHSPFTLFTIHHSPLTSSKFYLILSYVAVTDVCVYIHVCRYVCKWVWLSFDVFLFYFFRFLYTFCSLSILFRLFIKKCLFTVDDRKKVAVVW